MRNLSFAKQRTGQSGFSLIELMVGMVLSLVLLAGVISMFVSSRATYETTDQLSRLQESGRFALDVIVRDLRSAGFTGCNRRAEFVSSLDTTTEILWNFARPVEGFDAQGGGWAPALDTVTIINPSTAGDAIAIRFPRGDFEPIRITDPMALDTDAIQVDPTQATNLSEGDVVQASDCTSRGIFQISSAAGGVVTHPAGAIGTHPPGNLNASAGAAFGQMGEVVPMNSVVYFLRGNAANRSLWRRVASADAAEEVVEGIESMQFLYGEDTDNDAQISVDEYRNADAVEEWNQVLSVRIALLVRSMTEYGTDRDEAVHQVLDEEVPAANDRRLRQVFSTTVTVRNTAI